MEVCVGSWIKGETERESFFFTNKSYVGICVYEMQIVFAKPVFWHYHRILSKQLNSMRKFNLIKYFSACLMIFSLTFDPYINLFFY